MITPQLQTALNDLAHLEEGIRDAQAHIRVLDDYGKINTMELKSKLREAVQAAESMKAAIAKEALYVPQ